MTAEEKKGFFKNNDSLVTEKLARLLRREPTEKDFEKVLVEVNRNRSVVMTYDGEPLMKIEAEIAPLLDSLNETISRTTKELKGLKIDNPEYQIKHAHYQKILIEANAKVDALEWVLGIR